MGGESQPFTNLADGFRLPGSGETTEVQISAIESAVVLFGSVSFLSLNRSYAKIV